MRFVWGPPPENPDFAPEVEGWTRLREPPVRMVMLLTLLLGFGEVALARPLIEDHWGLDLTAVMIAALAVFLPVVIVHEALHALALAGGRCRPAITAGFWPKWLSFYVAFSHPVSRGRFLFTLLLPTIVLSLIPFGLLAAGVGRNIFFVAAALINLMSAGGDLIYAATFLSVGPRHAVYRNQGWTTWWRLPRGGGAAP